MKRITKLNKKIYPLLVASALSVVIAVSSIIMLVYAEKCLRENTVTSYIKAMENQLDDITENVSDIDELVDRLGGKAGSASYFFVYSDDGVLLEKNASETEKYLGMSMDNLRDYCERDGGEKLDDFFNSLGGKNDFSMTVFRSQNRGEEQVAVKFLSLDGDTYAIGETVTTAYVLSSAKIGTHILQMRVLCGVLMGLMVVSTVATGLVAYNRALKIQALEKDNKIKSLKIEELCECAESGNDGLEKDGETGLYSRQFFDTFIRKMDRKRITTAKLLVIVGRDSQSAMYEYGRKSVVVAFDNAGRILNTLVDENTVCARLSEDTFAMVSTNESVDLLRENIAVELDDAGYANGFIIAGGEITSSVHESLAEYLKQSKYDEEVSENAIQPV